MIKNNRYYTQLTGVLCLLFFAFNTNAQQNVPFDKENITDKKLLKQAEALIREAEHEIEVYGAYDLALEDYLKVQEINPFNAENNYKIGLCYLMSAHHDRTLCFDYFNTAKKLKANHNKEIDYYLGYAFHLREKWDSAVHYYQAYENYDLSDDERKSVNKKISECKFGKELQKSPMRVKITNMGQAINSKYPDAIPYITADGQSLFFTSRRENTTGGGKDPFDRHYFEDIYVSTKNEKGYWNGADNLGTPVNTEDHDASVGVSPDGLKLLIYKDVNGGDIFKSELVNKVWSTPKALNINSKYKETSACISYDGSKLYFTSNRPGGYGGYDIYEATRDAAGDWEDIRNLGPTVNSPYDEEGVFIQPDNRTLYFSSNGHNTMGGFDIFKTEFIRNRWTTPENMGFPLNSANDELYFSLEPDGRTGYYSTIKSSDTYGAEDIYQFVLLGPEKPLVTNKIDDITGVVEKSITDVVISQDQDLSSAKLTIYKGVVIDSSSTAPVETKMVLTDITAGEEIYELTTDPNTGAFMMILPSGGNYAITVEAKGYLFYSENFNLPESAAFQEIERKIELVTIKAGSKVVLKNIFFESGKAALAEASKTELTNIYKFLEINPSIKVEISGHTDNIGSSSYNKKLSEYRAKSVVDYLIDLGIPEDRLTYKGYGFDVPIASNKTEEGRQQNRRTEFKITEY